MQEEIQAVIEEQGPYKPHKRTLTPPLLIVYIKHNLKTVITFLLVEVIHRSLTQAAAGRWEYSFDYVKVRRQQLLN